jgi:hypothetical protein
MKKIIGVAVCCLFLIGYLYIHVHWFIGLDRAIGYYIFGIIAGLGGGLIIGRRNVMYCVLPGLIAFFEGLIAYKYAVKVIWEEVGPNFENEGGFMEYDSSISIKATWVSAGLALLIATIVVLIFHLAAKRIANHQQQ